MNVVIRTLARQTFVLCLVMMALFVELASLVRPSRTEQLVASWYGLGDGFAGRTTANGETFDPYAYTAAHKTLPFDTKLEVPYGGESLCAGSTTAALIYRLGPRSILCRSQGDRAGRGGFCAGRGGVRGPGYSGQSRPE